MTTVFDFDVTTGSGKTDDLGRFRGSAMVLVNTASECGFAPQFAGLERLHQQFTDRGLVVLGFPCDQFGHQEPGDADEIQSFCSVNYGVTFPMMAKIDVNGPLAPPLFQWLTVQGRGVLGRKIRWNFTKFLISPDGTTVRRFGSRSTPESMTALVEAVLPGS